jgi:hypothetical protein
MTLRKEVNGLKLPTSECDEREMSLLIYNHYRFRQKIPRSTDVLNWQKQFTGGPSYSRTSYLRF